MTAPTPSPCIGICKLDSRQVCRGCGRTLTEITHWPYVDEAMRQRIAREAKRRLAGHSTPERD
jgi:hypothetical protein